MGTHWLVMDISGEGAAAPFSARVAGAGRCLPPTHLTTDELMSTTRHHTHIDLERLTGIHERRISVGDEDSYSLATSAGCLAKSALELDDVDAIVAAPGLRGYRAALATELRAPVERITVAADETIHTAALAAALHRSGGQLPAGTRVLLIAAALPLVPHCTVSLPDWRRRNESTRRPLAHMRDGPSAHEADGVLPFSPHSLCPQDRSRRRRKG